MNQPALLIYDHKCLSNR